MKLDGISCAAAMDDTLRMIKSGKCKVIFQYTIYTGKMTRSDDGHRYDTLTSVQATCGSTDFVVMIPLSLHDMRTTG